MASLRAAENAAQLAVALVLFSVPLWAGDYNASQIGLFLLYGMATQSVALCWGRVGFLPLGQALFFGIGAYASALILKGTQLMSPAIVFLCLVLAILAPAIVAYVIAIVIFSKRIDSGPYFSLITLALCMLAYLLVNRWADVTGGFNGLTGVPDLPGTDRYSSLYYVIASLSVCVTALFSWLAKRPIGFLWSAIAQNEERLQFFGFATHKLKAVAFATAGAVAGLGGALYAPHEGMVSPQAIGIVLSTQFIIWAAVEGKSSPLGAQLGAVIVGLVASVLRDVFAYWEVFVALGFIAVVRLFPDGLAGACRQLLTAIGIRHTSTSLAYAELAPRVRRASLDDKEKLLAFEDVRVEQGGVKILNGLELEISHGA
ncbi:branched-chain amino acid ABC transporter permease [Caballeronia sp. J97]|uniref:branched-chain amino acid ABC transporter permease n=1 Tax=Caballeronia sp. J97 TaxID=2805429 RepID=UPI002AAFF0E9|nr:branched-chain amino acid ABC transporter permease [Caballeronia sp. J97]